MKNIIRYTISAVCVFFIGLFAFSPNFREATIRVWFYYIIDKPVDYLERSVDQGALALELFDKQYVTAQNKLGKLKALKMDVELSVQRTQERIDSFKRQGKEDLVLRNEQQLNFYRTQLAGYDKSITSRTSKLVELKTMREQAREDVKLARERINLLKATREALSDGDQQDIIDRAQENVASLQSYSNQLTSEISVLTED